MDLRLAFRALVRNPGYAFVVILILAAGIGANTAMFSVVDGVLVRPLPFSNPERLYAIQEMIPKFSAYAPDFPANAMHFLEWRKHWTAAEQISLLSPRDFTLTSVGAEPEKIHAARISASLFPMLGVSPKLGRGFTVEEDQDGRDQVILLSDSLWRKRFHADPAVVGRKVMLSDRPYEVIGVMPAGLELPRLSQLQSVHVNDNNPDLWKPLAISKEEMEPLGDFNFGAIVKLRPDASPARALDELNALEAAIVRDLPDKVELRAKLVPLQAQLTGRSRAGLLMLLSAVGAVLLIVCVNVANLMLARATGRRREFAIRAAVGASSARLLRQMLTESLVLAILGGAFGVAIAYASLHLIIENAPIELARMNEVHIDARALAVAAGLSILSALLFGLLPAWKASRADPQAGLRSGGRSFSESRQSGRLRTVLVAAEVALSTICLAAAGLLLNSFVRVLHVDKGFDAQHVTSVELYLAGTRYPDGKSRAEFLRKALDAVRPLPGASSVAAAAILPLTGEGNNNLLIAEGVEIPMVERPIVDMRGISPDYFRALGIPLRGGRLFEEADRQRLVAIVGESTASRVWPGENAIGKRIHLGEKSEPALEIVGIAGDVRADRLQKSAQLVVYLPYWMQMRSAASLIVRTGMDPRSIASAVRAELRKLDPELPVPRFRTMQEIVDASVAERRFQLALVLSFAGIALALASLGIFGVVSYSVAQRRGEMGIRLALGATSGDLRMMVLRQGLAPVAIGLAAGLAGALALGRALEGLLYGVKPADSMTLAAVAALLLAVGAAACWLPALRASRADPLTALRWE
jgi:putative ABC transport system permease protein